MKKLTPRTLALVAAGLVALVALGGWFAVVSPQRSKAESLDAKIADQQSKLTVAQLLARSKKAGEPNMSGAKLLVKAMPASLQMPSVLRQVRSLASASKVTIESFTPSTATPAAGYDVVPIDVGVTGRYASVQTFLHRLRAQAGANGGRIHATGRLFDVDTVDLTSAEDAPQLTASIKLATFVYTGAPLATTDTTTTTATTEEGV